MSNSSLRCLLGLVVVTLVGSCAATPKHQYELAPGRAYTPDLRIALLIGINETNPVVGGLEKGEDTVFELVQSLLKQQGLELEIPKARDHEKAADAAAATLRRRMLSGEAAALREIDYADLVPSILEELDSSADLVIVPNMVMRSAVWGTKTLRWDGVRRRVPGTGAMEMSGTGSAASLHVAIFAADGTRVFAGYGGLDVIWEINRAEEKMDLIPDRLEDIDNLREGVCIAFHPFFGDTPCP